MKKITPFLINLISIFLLLLISLKTFAQTPQLPMDTSSVSVSKKSQSTLYVKASHPEFSIRLPENVTTGYSWFIKRYNPNFIQVLGKTHQNHPHSNTQKSAVGMPGTAVFNFKVLPAALTAPQHLQVTLIYARPWQIQSGEIQTFDIVTSSP